MPKSTRELIERCNGFRRTFFAAPEPANETAPTDAYRDVGTGRRVDA
jgi:hypothetical protein